MKKSFWVAVITILLFAFSDAQGQRWRLMRYEADLYISGVAFHGDIGLANRHLMNNINGYRPSIGFKPGFRVNQEITISLDLMYLMYGGKDEEGSTHIRTFTFNSHAFQHAVRAEYYIFGENRRLFSGALYNRRGMINNYNKVYVYAFAGVGGLLVKPKVKDQDGVEPFYNRFYDPGFHYTATFPLGAGMKWALDPRWSIGVELGYQFTLSDYLDGYASPFSEYKDSFYLNSVKMIYKIRNDRNNRPTFRKLYR